MPLCSEKSETIHRDLIGADDSTSQKTVMKSGYKESYRKEELCKSECIYLYNIKSKCFILFR